MGEAQHQGIAVRAGWLVAGADPLVDLLGYALAECLCIPLAILLIFSSWAIDVAA